jgi:soluble lytic murein transglycosylase-like protein
VSEPARRRALAAAIVAAARGQRVDPDLLFAVVAVESGFHAHAVSPRGARGLGQLLFGTAHEVAPHRVRRPRDLDEPARNLEATARLLHALLVRSGGDLDRALRAYYGGPWDPAPERPDRERYGLKVAARYAALKALRTHHALMESPDRRAERRAPGAGRRAPAPQGRGDRAERAALRAESEEPDGAG